jgi:F-type H+-transporting ATPase subunit alpha
LTGTALVDLLIPLGKGQKQLILGDRKSGKSTFVRTTVINQIEEGAIAIYAAIGKTKAEIKYLEQFVKHQAKKERIIVVAASAFDSPGLIYLTPFTAMGLAEYFRDRGENCLVIMDDLLTHAKFYREFSLLAQAFPGRDSYPGDIFHIHARLLERAGNFKYAQDNQVSISAIPIVETQEGDLTGYVVSNLMSITDGHIFFDANVFARGRRPAINIPLSVTRVGKQTQKKLLRDINRELYSFFAIYDRVENLSHFGSELTASVKSILESGERIFAFFNQPEGLIVPDEVAVVLFAIVWLNLLDGKKLSDGKDLTLEVYRERLIQAYKNEQTKAFFQSMLNVDSLNPLLKQIKNNADKLFAI